MLTPLKNIFIGLLVLMSVQFAAAQDVQEVFRIKAAEVRLAAEQATKQAGQKYSTSLDARIVALQRAGNLEGLLTAKKMKEQYETDQSAPAEAIATDRALENARQTYLRAANGVEAQRRSTMVKLLDHYVEVLPNQIKELVQQGELESAVAAKAELVRAEAELETYRSNAPRAAGSIPAGRAYIPAGAARFIRLHIDSSHSAREVQLSEIEFSQGDNVIPVRVKGFSSEFSAGWAAKRVVDGDTNTGWANADSADEKYPHWFVFEAKDERPFQLNRIRLHTISRGAGNYRIKEFSVYLSNDGTRWQKCLAAELDGEKSPSWETFSCRPSGGFLAFE